MKVRVLVEDETSISEPLAAHLAREGFDPEVAGALQEAAVAYESREPDFLLLDVMHPDGDGRDARGDGGAAS
jgi:DNA-binding response OmpR family regulator